MSILISILLILSFKTFASEERAQNLLFAKDIRDLKSKIHLYSESKKLQTKCEFELLNNLVPKSCYRLKLDGTKLEVIDQACEKASYNMKEEVGLEHLSKTCQAFVNKKNKDIRYRQEETQPEKLIK
jgi:hypothetical protein